MKIIWPNNILFVSIGAVYFGQKMVLILMFKLNPVDEWPFYITAKVRILLCMSFIGFKSNVSIRLLNISDNLTSIESVNQIKNLSFLAFYHKWNSNHHLLWGHFKNNLLETILVFFIYKKCGCESYSLLLTFFLWHVWTFFQVESLLASISNQIKYKIDHYQILTHLSVHHFRCNVMLWW